MFGSVSNLVILRESRQHFDRNMCFYLQALSVTDIFYLCFMIGYLVIPTFCQMKTTQNKNILLVF